LAADEVAAREGLPRRVRPPVVADRGHILVVDDIPDNRDLLARLLQREGYTSVLAVDGLEALEVLRREAVDAVLMDVMMPRLDGIGALEAIQRHPDWRHVPVIMISADNDEEKVLKCLEVGAVDYLKKPIVRPLLRARVNASVERKRLRDREQQALRALSESQARLSAELAEAAAYVQSLLPARQVLGFAASWTFRPSTSLGGDFLGYHAIDADHAALYLLDVSGHGVGAALLSISVANALRSESLADVDFRHPAQVLAALNDAFPMEANHGMYFTLWYGVYRRPTRTLSYATGGHPPALLLPPGGTAADVRALRTPGLTVGFMEGAAFQSAEEVVPPGTTLCLFSDGAYEMTKEDGTEMAVEDLQPLLAAGPVEGKSRAGSLYSRIVEKHGSEVFDDDLSILYLVFD
jgi:sigma-B regulation protein RsbU (phosphoserine phosphatase)